MTRPATPTLQPRPGARPLSSPRCCSSCPPSPRRIASSSCSSPPSQPQQPPRCARLACGRLQLRIWCGNCTWRGGRAGRAEGWAQGWFAASLGPDSPSPLTLGKQLRHLEGRGLYLLCSTCHGYTCHATLTMAGAPPRGAGTGSFRCLLLSWHGVGSLLSERPTCPTGFIGVQSGTLRAGTRAVCWMGRDAATCEVRGMVRGPGPTAGSRVCTPRTCGTSRTCRAHACMCSLLLSVYNTLGL